MYTGEYKGIDANKNHHNALVYRAFGHMKQNLALSGVSSKVSRGNGLGVTSVGAGSKASRPSISSHGKVSNCNGAEVRF